MKHPAYHILSLLGLPVVLLLALVFVGCADERVDLTSDDDTPLEVGVSAPWQCGRTLGKTRALTDPIGSDPEKYPDECYPDWLHITVGPHATWEASYGGDPNRPEKFVIKKTYEENDNYDDLKFIAYHGQYKLSEYKDDGTPQAKPFYTKSKARKLTWEARTLSPRYNALGDIPQAWDETDYTTFNSLDLLSSGGMALGEDDPKYGGKYTISGKHLFFTLGHAYALVRLFFAVDSKYDRIRFIDLKNVTMNGLDIIHEAHYILPVANADNTNTSGHGLYAYAYFKPSHQWNGDAFADASSLGDDFKRIGTSTDITVECTYDIYDKDPAFTYGSSDAPTTEQETHRTRVDVVARNTLTFGKLKDSSDAKVSKIQAGYYYDLYITINPDYLYVLSEHDNKHIVIN